MLRTAAFRHLLLPRGGGGDRGRRRAWPSAGTQRLSQPARPPLQESPADHPVREPAALPADERHGRLARRGHGRRHRGPEAPHRAAVGRSAGRDRPRARPRAGARVPVRHHERGAQATGELPAVLRLPLWFIEGMAEYLSVGPRRSAHRDVDARRDPRARSCRPSSSSTTRSTSRTATARRSGPTSAGRYGDAAVGRMLRTAARSGDPQKAIKEVLGISHEELSQGMARGAPRRNTSRCSTSKKVPSQATAARWSRTSRAAT